jgi:hypothetical protein
MIAPSLRLMEGRLNVSSSNHSSTMQELTISDLDVLKRRRSFIILSTLFCVSMAIFVCIFVSAT